MLRDTKQREPKKFRTEWRDMRTNGGNARRDDQSQSQSGRCETKHCNRKRCKMKPRDWIQSNFKSELRWQNECSGTTVHQEFLSGGGRYSGSLVESSNGKMVRGLDRVALSPAVKSCVSDHSWGTGKRRAREKRPCSVDHGAVISQGTSVQKEGWRCLKGARVVMTTRIPYANYACACVVVGRL